MPNSREEATSLLVAATTGDPHAAQKFIQVVYAELKRLAAHYMRGERPDHTLQPTALVHEAYLQLVDQKGVSWQNRAHFVAVAAQAMREILVDHARAHRAAKRGGNQARVSLHDAFAATDDRSEELLAIHEALGRLAAEDSQQSRIVELRFFAGLTLEETAEALGISLATVKRDWNIARAWLYRELDRGKAL
jgi:RNA polymerase sigma-70 factor, ECF subfamily